MMNSLFGKKSNKKTHSIIPNSFKLTKSSTTQPPPEQTSFNLNKSSSHSNLSNRNDISKISKSNISSPSVIPSKNLEQNRATINNISQLTDFSNKPTFDQKAPSPKQNKTLSMFQPSTQKPIHLETKSPSISQKNSPVITNELLSLQDSQKSDINKSVRKSTNPKSSSIWVEKNVFGAEPFPRRGFSVALHGSDMYLFGGRAAGKLRNDLIKLETNKFEASEVKANGTFPKPREGHASAFIGRTMFVFGGELDDGRCDEGLYAFNIGNEMWYNVPVSGKSLIGRKGHTAISASSCLYIFGGTVEGHYLQDLAVFDVKVAATNGPSWSFINAETEIPPGRAGHSCNHYQGKLYIYGGMNGEVCFNDLWTFSIDERKWSQVVLRGATPPARYGHASSMVDDCIFIMGGRTMEGQAITDFFAYKINSQRWYTFPVQSSKWPHRVDPILSVVRNKLVLFSGNATPMPDSMCVHILDTNKIKIMPDSGNAKPARRSTDTAGIRKSAQPSLTSTQDRRYTESAGMENGLSLDSIPKKSPYLDQNSSQQSDLSTQPPNMIEKSIRTNVETPKISSPRENLSKIHSNIPKLSPQISGLKSPSDLEKLKENGISSPKIGPNTSTPTLKQQSYSPSIDQNNPKAHLSNKEDLVNRIPNIQANDQNQLNNTQQSQKGYNIFPIINQKEPQSPHQQQQTAQRNVQFKPQFKPQFPKKDVSSQSPVLSKPDPKNESIKTSDDSSVITSPVIRKVPFEPKLEQAKKSETIIDNTQTNTTKPLINEPKGIPTTAVNESTKISTSDTRSLEHVSINTDGPISQNVPHNKSASLSPPEKLNGKMDSMSNDSFLPAHNQPNEINGSTNGLATRSVNNIKKPTNFHNRSSVTPPSTNFNHKTQNHKSVVTGSGSIVYVPEIATTDEKKGLQKENGQTPKKDKRLTIQLRNRMSHINVDDNVSGLGITNPSLDNAEGISLKNGTNVNGSKKDVHETSVIRRTFMKNPSISEEKDTLDANRSELSKVDIDSNDINGWPSNTAGDIKGRAFVDSLELDNNILNLHDDPSLKTKSSKDLWIELETKYGIMEESENPLGETEKDMELPSTKPKDVAKLATLVVALRKELDSTKSLLSQSLKSAIDKINEAEKARRAALQEAIYLKAKSSALASGNIEMLSKINAQRTSDLERQLANTINENDALRNQMSESNLILKRTQERLAEFQSDSKASRQQLRHMEQMYQLSSTSLTLVGASTESNGDGSTGLGVSPNTPSEINPSIMQELTYLRNEVSSLRSNEQGLLLDVENALRASSASNDRSDKLQVMLDESTKENEQLEAEMMKLVAELESERSVNSRLKSRLDKSEKLLLDYRSQVSALSELKNSSASLINKDNSFMTGNRQVESTSNSITNESIETNSHSESKSPDKEGLGLSGYSTQKAGISGKPTAEMHSAFLSTQRQWIQARDEIMTLRQSLRDSNERCAEAEEKLATKERDLENSLARLSAFTKLIENLNNSRRNRTRSVSSVNYNQSESISSINRKSLVNSISSMQDPGHLNGTSGLGITNPAVDNNVVHKLHEADGFSSQGKIGDSEKALTTEVGLKENLDNRKADVISGSGELKETKEYINPIGHSISPSNTHSMGIMNFSMTDDGLAGDSSSNLASMDTYSDLDDDNTVSLMLSTLHQLQKSSAD
ncbi:hypothetical protein BB559_000262 [Furculomyces boomerangus]|uniref:Tip elongation aberrant protein 1 n=1 Tax=Furculomyces boomerangus TaxID=61424 RepID=A0A2T9Z5S2_9FUNG|nr:hypothetical protein BB559_000262 [Furculomyces boomerangus]